MTDALADTRTSTMARRYESGETLQQIADDYSLSRERVRQIIKRVGVTGKDGGVSKQAAIRKELKTQESESRFLLARGMSKSEFTKISRKYGKEPYESFVNRRRNSLRDNESWNLSFGEYWSIWVRSGKWEERGRGRKFQFHRIDPSLPWQSGNIVIQDGESRQREYINQYWGKTPGGTLTKRLNRMSVGDSLDIEDRTASAISQAVKRCSVRGRLYLRKQRSVWRVQ